jgi:hypothetical protein
MTLRAVNNSDEDPEQTSAPCEIIPACPICNGKMEKVYDRYHQQVCVCVDCHTGLSIPASARNVARLKKQNRSA